MVNSGASSAVLLDGRRPLVQCLRNISWRQDRRESGLTPCPRGRAGRQTSSASTELARSSIVRRATSPARPLPKGRPHTRSETSVKEIGARAVDEIRPGESGSCTRSSEVVVVVSESIEGRGREPECVSSTVLEVGGHRQPERVESKEAKHAIHDVAVTIQEKMETRNKGRKRKTKKKKKKRERSKTDQTSAARRQRRKKKKRVPSGGKPQTEGVYSKRCEERT